MNRDKFGSFVAVLICLAGLGGGCEQDASGAGGRPAEPKPAAPAVPAAPTVLAEATNPSVPLVVQVLEVRRATPDTVRVALAFISRATGSERLRLLGDADPSDFCLITADGARRLFLLRDVQNKPVLDGNVQPLRPGERRVLQAIFPAPPAGSRRVTLLLGKLAVRDLPISE